MVIVKYSQGQIKEVVPSEKVDEVDNPLIEKEASKTAGAQEKDQKEEPPKWTK